MEKVEKYITEAMNWLNSKMNAQNKLSLTQDPVVKVAEILTKSKVKKKKKSHCTRCFLTSFSLARFWPLC